MKLTLCVKLEGEFGQYVACKDVDDYQKRCFEPDNTCDDYIMATVTGARCLPDRNGPSIVVKTREDVAKRLAEELIPMIVEAMKKNDTHNGYKVDSFVYGGAK